VAQISRGQNSAGIMSMPVYNQPVTVRYSVK